MTQWYPECALSHCPRSQRGALDLLCIGADKAHLRPHAWPQPLPRTGRGARDPAANPIPKSARVTLRAALPKFHASREIHLDLLGDVHDDRRVNSRQSECEFVDDTNQRNLGISFSSVHFPTWWQHQVTDSGLHTQVSRAPAHEHDVAHRCVPRHAQRIPRMRVTGGNTRSLTAACTRRPRLPVFPPLSKFVWCRLPGGKVYIYIKSLLS